MLRWTSPIGREYVTNPEEVMRPEGEKIRIDAIESAA